jgi:hypothetical protein
MTFGQAPRAVKWTRNRKKFQPFGLNDDVFCLTAAVVAAAHFVLDDLGSKNGTSLSGDVSTTTNPWDVKLVSIFTDSGSPDEDYHKGDNYSAATTTSEPS